MAVAAMQSAAPLTQSYAAPRQRANAGRPPVLAAPQGSRRAGSVVTQAFYGPSLYGRARSCYASSSCRSPVMGFGMMGPMLASDWLKRSTSSVHPMDIRTREEAYEVQADCPGVADEDISVEVSPDNILTVAGVRRSNTPPADNKAAAPESDNTKSPDALSLSAWDEALGERAAGSKTDKAPASHVTYRFKRSFVLPEDALVDGISAALDKGVLTVTIPRKQVDKPKPRRVTINTNKGPGLRVV